VRESSIFLINRNCPVVIGNFFLFRIEDVENLTSEKNRLSQSLDHKTNKVLDLETKYDILKSVKTALFLEDGLDIAVVFDATEYVFDLTG